MLCFFLIFSETTEEIELMVIGNDQANNSSGPGHVGAGSCVTPPVHCSSRNSMVDGGSGRASRRAATTSVTPADSMEYINKIIADKPVWPGRTGSHGKYISAIVLNLFEMFDSIFFHLVHLLAYDFF